ncbi:MAG: hypothetical protein IT572_03530, partial [Deltaproteobacteria bacterium]|nr:hypothetical protein [Deltaproteobacteria bacterium]
DGGGAGGGPVGGGNFAAGPVSLPAPSIVAPDAPVTWTSISCTNTPGPNFECRGTSQSVQPNTEIQFRIFAPAAAVPRDTFTTVADAQGVWSVTRAGEAGESVEICPKENGVCGSFRLYKLPPEGGVVDGNSGTMKNLVIDPQGDSWHSRLLPKSFKLGRLVASWFVTEARAQETLRPYTPIFCGDVTSFEILEAVGTAPVPKCDLFRAQRGGGPSLRAVTFDNCQQSDIRSVVSLRHPRTGQPVLLVAVKNRVHVVETQPAPRIVWAYSFPGDVVSILDQGDRFVAVVNAPTGVAHNLYYVDLRQKAPEGTGCYPALDWLKGTENVTSSDSLSEAFTMVVYKQPGVYQVMLGRHVPGSTAFRNHPRPLLPPSNTPLEARILKVEENYVWVAVLNAAQKNIKIVKRFLPDTELVLLGGEPNPGPEITLEGLKGVEGVKRFLPEAGVIALGGEADPVQEIALEGLSLGVSNLSVSRPHLFNVNRETRELVFVDVSEQGSKFVAIPYTWVDGNLAPIRTASVTDLGGASPASLRRDNTEGNTGWAYNDGSWQIRRVRSQRENLQIQVPAHLLTDGVPVQFYLRDGVAPAPATEEDEE